MLAVRSAAAAVGGKASIYVQVRDIAQYYAQITAAGAAVTHCLAQREYGMRDCRIVDPDGNELSFGEPSSG